MAKQKQPLSYKTKYIVGAVIQGIVFVVLVTLLILFLFMIACGGIRPCQL